MGYRSKVAFVIEFDSAENAKYYFTEIDVPLVDWATFNNYLYLQENLIIFYCDQIKWYADCSGYDDINHLVTAYKKSSDATGWVGWVFKRLGEDNDDYEYDYGSADPDWDCYDYIQETRLLELGV